MLQRFAKYFVVQWTYYLFLICDASLIVILGAAAPGFNSLIPAPSVPSLISTEPVELICGTSNISSTDPFCLVKQKTGSG